MATAPLILLTIVVVLDLLFLLNYYFVRRVRLSVEREEPDEIESERTTTSPSSTTFLGSNFLGTGYAYRFLYALFYDDIYREPNQVLQFPLWRKKWIAILSTSFLVVGSSFIMSPQLILANSDLSPLIQNAVPDFCVAKDAKMDEFRALLRTATAVDAAEQQATRIRALHGALQHDLSRMGEAAYPCHSNSVNGGGGTKAAYAGQETIHGPFFPGYCPSAREESLRLAQTEHCSQKVCAVNNNNNNTSIGATWVQQCVDTITTCPAQTDDALPEALAYYSAQLESVTNTTEQAIQFAQTFAAENNSDGGGTYERASELLRRLLYQVDVASTAYVFYSCMTLLFPAPILLHRSPIRSMANRFFLGVNRYQFIGLVLILWWTFEYYGLVWFSPQLKLYAINMLRDPCFVDADYWVERQGALADVCRPLLDHTNVFTTYGTAIQHMVREAELFVSDCCASGPFPYLRLQELASVELWDEHWNSLGFDTVPSFLRSYGKLVFWGRRKEGRSTRVCCFGFFMPLTVATLHLYPSGNVLFPTEQNFTFAGNTTICSEILAAERMVLATRPDVNYNFWDLWVKSGLVASLFFKVALANFGLALYWLADPLSRCGGTYEYPREQHVDYNIGLDLKAKTVAGLDAISTKWAIVWFLLVKMCLANLFAATDWSNFVWDSSDPLVYAATVLASVGAVVGLVFALGICIVSHYGARTLVDWIFATLTCGAIRCRKKRKQPQLTEAEVYDTEKAAVVPSPPQQTNVL